MSEQDLVAQLSEAQRAMFAKARDARAKFEALLDLGGEQLRVAETVAASGARCADALQTYEALILAADRRLRSPEARARPRDKLYKRFEGSLKGHIAALKAIEHQVTAEDLDVTRVVVDTTSRLRLAALSSAIDSDPSILSRPAQDP